MLNLLHYWMTNPPINDILEDFAIYFQIHKPKEQQDRPEKTPINKGSLSELQRLSGGTVGINRKPKTGQ